MSGDKEARTRPLVGVAAIVIRDGCLLMQRREGAHGAGTWSCPGGKMEHGEWPEATAERETLEETGVAVKATARLAYTSDVHPTGEHYVTLFVACEWVSGEPVVTEPDRCPEVGWVPLDAVASLHLFLPLRRLVDDHLHVWELPRESRPRLRETGENGDG